MSTVEEVATELRTLGYRVEPIRIPGAPVVLNVWRPDQDVYTMFVVSGPFTAVPDSTPLPDAPVVTDLEPVPTFASKVAESIDESVATVLLVPVEKTGSVDVSESIVLNDLT